ncbi:MAG: PAS domain-containing protein, partial [Clostridiales bacterium]|nr:PAS domain-containing protein [Clostridiales bacterium]
LKDSESMSHTGHWVRDLKTKNYIFSDELYRIFGLSKKIKLISADLLHERFHPDDAARIIEYTEKCLKEGKDYNFEGRLLMPDNAIKYIKASVKISKNDTGIPISAKGIMSDVTEAALYKQKLIRNEMQLKTAEDIAKVGNWVQDLKTNEYICSDGFLKICGIEDADDGTDYIKVMRVTHPDDLDYIESIIADSLKSGSDYEFENRIIRPNGEIRYVRSKGTYIKDINGKPIKSMGTLLDITEYKENENRLLEIQNRLIRAESIAHIGHWERNYITGKSYWSDEVYKILGVKAQSFVASEKKYASFIHPDDIKKFSEDSAKAIKGEIPYDIESRIIHSNGEIKYVRIIGDTISNAGVLVKTFGTVEDITAAKLHEAELIKKNRTLENAEAVAHIGHWERDFNNNSMYWSDEIFRLLGYEPGSFEVVQNKEKEFFHADDWEKFRSAYQITKEEGVPFEIDIRAYKSDKSEIIMKLKGGVTSAIGEPLIVSGTTEDVTEIKKHYEDFEYLIYHDSLTDLLNRRTFNEKFKEIDKKSNYPLSVIIADINGLKMINDTAGYSTGDRILMKTARILKSVCQDGDFLARIGGDDFILILPRTVKSQAQIIINDLHDLFNKANAEVPFSVSIGVAVKTIEDVKTRDIIKDAEDNMYSNKLYEKSSKRGDMLRLIMDALYERSSREEMHSERVSKYCEEMGIALKMQKHKINELSALGLLHDIGKIAVKDSILNKPGELDEDEWQEIKRHPETGYRILSNAPGMQDASNYILLHHERWDGKGYPKGLSTYDIPLQARIIAIGDAFDAMRSKRPYRDPLSLDTAVAEIIKGAGTQFDPELAKVFVVEVLGKEWS